MIKNNLKLLAVQNGYNSIMDFSKKNNLSYMRIYKLANDKMKTYDKDLLVEICTLLGCEIGELLVIKK
jgi:DNA-binding Xre family transcriptional regulator